MDQTAIAFPNSSYRPARAGAGRSKEAQVHAELKEAILSGRLAPGAPIDKAAVCSSLGVSRFPVTAAINRLAFERLVVILPQHGSFVARIVLPDMLECMTIRAALEGELAALAAARRPAGLIEALDRSLRYQAVAATAGDTHDVYRLDVGFHAALSTGLGLTQASDILDGLRARLERIRRLLTAPPKRPAATFREHEAIRAAIAAGDPEGARAAMRHHLAQTTALFETFARANAALFADRT